MKCQCPEVDVELVKDQETDFVEIDLGEEN